MMKAKMRKLPSGNQISLIDGAWCSASAAEAQACATPKSSKKLTPRSSREPCSPSPELSFLFQWRQAAVLSVFGSPLPAVLLPALPRLPPALDSRVFHVAGVPAAESPPWLRSH